MNDSVWTIYNTIEICELQRDMRIEKLAKVLNEQTMKECQDMKESIKEAIYLNVVEWQRTEFNRRYQKGKDGCVNPNTIYSPLGGHQKGNNIHSTTTTSTTTASTAE